MKSNENDKQAVLTLFVLEPRLQFISCFQVYTSNTDKPEQKLWTMNGVDVLNG